MRYSHAEKPLRVSDDVFRLLSLRLEVQNDVEVIKPVLEELEVMRLSCALGMLTSVNLKDFTHDLLEAREFDDDFARFLRTDVFAAASASCRADTQQQRHGRIRRRSHGDDDEAMEASDSDTMDMDVVNSSSSDATQDVYVMSLFGQQSEVKSELARLGCWSDACEARLRAQDQGIYCAHMLQAQCRHDDDTDTDANKSLPRNKLVLFAWLQDHLFQHERLRDTATYILRFLTCLSPHIVCCLSAADVARVRALVAAMANGTTQPVKSYSVAFRVERQETERDEVRCEHVRDIDLSLVAPTGLTTTAVSAAHAAAAAPPNLRLIKGSFPAMVATTLAPATTRMVHKKAEFVRPDELAQWLAARAREVKLHVNYGTRIVDHSFRQRFLTALDAMPAREFAQIEDVFERSTVDAEARSREDVDAFIEEQRALLLSLTPQLFSVELLLNSAEMQRASAVLTACLDKLRSDKDVWSRLDVPTQITVFLPVRLRTHMKNFYGLFNEHMDTELHDALEKIESTRTRDMFADTSIGSRSSLLASIQRGIRGWFSNGKKDESDISSEFRDRMAPALEHMKVVWWEVVEKALDAIRTALPTKWAAESVTALRRTCDEDRRKAVTKAFLECHQAWADDAMHELSVRVDVRGRQQSILCDVREEVWEPPMQQMEVFKIDVDSAVGSGVRSLGVFPLRQHATVLDVFSIQTNAVLVVTTSSDGVSVERVHFAARQLSYVNYATKGNTTLVKRFGRQATHCDFLASERLIAFVSASDDVLLYKFSETFASMEVIHSVKVGMCTSLMTPLTDLLLLENGVFLRDATHAAQSINYRNQQTSRKSVGLLHHGSSNDGDEAARRWTSGAFSLADGLVVASLSVKDGEMGSSVGAIAAISSEDHRKVPVTFASASGVLLASTAGVSVQAFGNALLIADPLANRVQVFDVRVTVRTDSFRIRHSSGKASARGQRQVRATSSSSSSRDNTADLDETTAEREHWLWAFYHVFEKFPVAGLLDSDSSHVRAPLQVKVVCPSASANSDAVFADCCAYFASIMEHLRKLNKPLGDMDLPRDLVVVAYTGSGKQRLADELARLSPRPLAAFLQDVVTFVPIQICRAEANMLTIMTDGQDTSQDETESLETSRQLQSADIARSIRFGLLSPLLESWRGRCIVVTSMGKQSTGKSYFLNHLTGSSFAIAGQRCTDGAWMTLRVLPSDVLLVVVDFEGLGSFERTEQEDVFLSVLNAALSMFTVFRIDMRLDKEIDELFSKFQRGVQLIKNDPRLFRGILYMGVKDVNPNDQSGVVDEFVAKFEKLVSANKEHNFLCEMYSGQLEINCSPPLGTSGYYESLTDAQQFIQDVLCSDAGMGFSSGRAFLDCIRLVLAKISILDWTSLDESNQKLQLSDVRAKLPGVVRTGCLVPVDHVRDRLEVPRHLKEDLGLGASEVNLHTLCEAHPELAAKWRELDTTVALDNVLDRDIDVGLDVCGLQDDAASMKAVGASMQQLFERFLRCLYLDTIPSKLSTADQSAFDLFLLFATRRRKLRILAWVRARLGDRLPDDWQALEAQHLGRFQTLWTRCARTCGSCQLGCMLPGAHASVATEHDCGTNHKCHGRCVYCRELSSGRSDSSSSSKTPLCAKPAGHEGKCECADGDHTCSEECCMVRAVNCELHCVELVGHDGMHHCSVAIHRCGMACSATNCSGACILSIATPHSAHKCEHTTCTMECSMDGCHHLCGHGDHFHGQTDVAVTYSVEHAAPSSDKNSGDARVFDAESQTPTIHMCAREHECQAMCDEQGNCCVEVVHKESSKTFAGSRGVFTYRFQEMNGFRKKCAVVLAPGQQTHTGAHTCIAAPVSAGSSARRTVSSDDGDDDGSHATENSADDADDDETKPDDASRVLHYCEARCPCCSYFCTKPVGHFGMHATSHGNMRNTYFLADTHEIDVHERKYTAGESGQAEMCNLYCAKMGRAHVHYLDCDHASAATCVYAGDSKDQRRHCTRALEPKPAHALDEVLHEQFWKTLGWEDPCSSPAERALFGACAYTCDAPEHSKKPSFCVLPAWHKPVSKPAQHDGFAYVSGHKFECSHLVDSGKMHHVFVLDCSGSMCGAPWTQLLAAYREYLHNRVSDGASLDLVSVVTFDSYAKIEHEAQNITTMLRADVAYRGGGTTYSAGLRAANEVLSRNAFATYKPVLVFFSDGQPCDPAQGEQLAAHIASGYAKYGLAAFAVGYGTVNLSVLERVAAKLGGSYHSVLLGTELKTAFHTISASLGTRAGLALTKPLHECNCPICQRDMAAEDVVTLRPCGHALHKTCKQALVAAAMRSSSSSSSTSGERGDSSSSSRARSSAEPVACPICRKRIVV